MTAFPLPADPGAADAALADLGALATATEWRRAAIVHARVLPNGRRRDPDCTSAIRRVTANQFSKRGVHGLASPHTVQAYRDAWQAAVDAGLTGPAALGGEVELPDAEWSDFYRGARAAIAREKKREAGPPWVDPFRVLQAAMRTAGRSLQELGAAVELTATETVDLNGAAGKVGPLLWELDVMRQDLDAIDRYLRRHAAATHITGPELLARIEAAGHGAPQPIPTGAPL